MLQKPNIPTPKIITCLQTEYDLRVHQINFLPLGADLNTAVYTVTTQDKNRYFLKLRGGVFDKASVTFPKFLSEQGIKQVIPPLTTKTGQLWATLDFFKTILLGVTQLRPDRFY